VSVWTPKIADQALVRKFVSLGGQGYIGISIQNGATAVDPDPDTLAIAIWFNDVLTNPAPNSQNTNPYGTQVATITADSITKVDTGKYYYDLGPGLTANRGLITAVWTYQVGGVAFTFTDHLQVTDPMPLYDSLSDQEKYVVEQVTWMFGDLYDSTEGGPHLIEEFQTHWNYERIAQMQQLAVQKMNFIGNYGNPPTSWGIGAASGTTYVTPSQQVTVSHTMPDGSNTTTTYYTHSSSSTNASAVPGNMSGLVTWGTYIECMRHFRDSYTEIPARPGMDVAYDDRRDYWSRWTQNLQSEQQQWTQAVKNAKLAMLGLGRGSLLVSGGIYGGNATGPFVAGTYAAQVRSWRFYPAAPAIMWGATSH